MSSSIGAVDAARPRQAFLRQPTLHDVLTGFGIIPGATDPQDQAMPGAWWTDCCGVAVSMRRVLIAHPMGARLYALTDDEFERFEYLLALEDPADRGAWAARFLGEREPEKVFPVGARGLGGLEASVDRAIGGNFFMPKWGRVRGGRTDPNG